MNRKLSIIVLAMVFGTVPLSAGATPFSFTAPDTPVPISDQQWSYSVIFANMSGSIEDLNVFVDLDHSWMTDLAIFIEHDGRTVQLFNEHGYVGDDLTDVLFDDEAASYIDAVNPPFGPGSFKPTSLPDPGYSTMLSAFDGMDVFGTWTLSIFDDSVYDQGTLNTFQIAGRTTPVPEPSAIFLVGAGLAGVAGVRRIFRVTKRKSKVP
ncbi:hypothetical protein D3OALGA1CA_2086 [Olavius algarvensis associated proteobacterium Delta 3]|nr:hypothetical protein D3OALGA1CA_2086 [Olavius algarvensis associated proteobacterium Delta 3]CAB5120921.1 hypothetical protein D3OALGB2SA_2980 [Olavius algarvensis associated proteobacterium Delta 3]